jgi:hypothetical protein
MTITFQPAPAPVPPEHEWVDSAPFRAHLRFLLSVSEASPEVVALLAGVAPRLARRVLTGDGGRPLRRISPDTARRLYAVTPAVLRECRLRTVPAAPVAATMRRMEVLGWSRVDWCEQLGLSQAAVVALASGRTRRCSYWVALQIRAAAVGFRSSPRAGLRQAA